MSHDIAALEADVKEFKLQLETVKQGLLADAENSELRTLQTDLEEVISLTNTTIAELKPASATASTSKKATTSTTTITTTTTPQQPAATEKWSKDKHPAYQAGYRPPAVPQSPIVEDTPQAPTEYKVNDTVLAKWKSGDKGFYAARIISATGPVSNRVYTVTFKNYSATENLYAREIKPISRDANGTDSKKRKADAPAPPKSSGVISAAADIDPILADQAKKEPSKVSDGPVRPNKVPRKVKANKELEAGKSKWQDFSTKGKLGPKTLGKKESMFRTPDGVNARVGFTGSGQEMRKDAGRSRHIYQQGGEDEY